MWDVHGPSLALTKRFCFTSLTYVSGFFRVPAERNDGLFYPLAYLTYKITEEVGMATISSLINSLITFYGLKLKGQFGFFWIHYVVGVSVGVLFAYLVATLAPSMDAANAILPAFMVTQMFFNGFLIIRSTIPNWWFWYHILSCTLHISASLFTCQKASNTMRKTTLWLVVKRFVQSPSFSHAVLMIFSCRVSCSFPTPHNNFCSHVVHVDGPHAKQL